MTLGGAGSFAKAGTLSIVAGSDSTVTTATFTLEDGQILDIAAGVSIAAGVVTIDKQTLDRAGKNILSGGNLTMTQVTSTAAAAALSPERTEEFEFPPKPERSAPFHEIGASQLTLVGLNSVRPSFRPSASISVARASETVPPSV